MSSRTRQLETVRENGDERVVGESCVAMSAGGDVRDAAAAEPYRIVIVWAARDAIATAEFVHDALV